MYLSRNSVWQRARADTFFWAGSSNRSLTTDGRIIPYPKSSFKDPQPINRTHGNILLPLPTGYKIRDFKWLSVSSRHPKVNFGRFYSPVKWLIDWSLINDRRIWLTFNFLATWTLRNQRFYRNFRVRSTDSGHETSSFWIRKPSTYPISTTTVKVQRPSFGSEPDPSHMQEEPKSLKASL